MLKILLASVIAFSLCSLLLPILMAKASTLRLLDSPGGRKQHKAPTPLVGGLAIGLSACSLILWPGFLASSLAWFWPPLLTLLLIGLLDDRHTLSPGFRLSAQIGAGLAMVYGAGISLSSLGDLLGVGAISLGLLGIPVTVFAVASAINAYNMIDGLDGLAGGLAFIPLFIITLLAANAGMVQEAMLAGVFAAACLTFLLVNYRFPWTTRARVFLGDTGSMILGFAIAWLLISLSEQGVIRPVTALFLIAIPLFDTAAVIVRRVLAGKRPMQPGRDHIHHLLRASGLSVTMSVVVIHSLAILITSVGLSLSLLGVAESIAFGLFCLMLVLFIALTTRVEAPVEKAAPGSSHSEAI